MLLVCALPVPRHFCFNCKVEHLSNKANLSIAGVSEAETRACAPPLPATDTNVRAHHPTMRNFLPFDEALAVARSLRLTNRSEWQQWCKEGMASQRALQPTPHLHGRRVARVGALAGQRRHQEGEQVCAV